MDMNTVFELHRRGLITDEVLAECLNEKYGQKNVEKTWEEKREELIEKNREQAEANRQKISEYEKKYRDEYYQKERDKEISEIETFLKKITNANGTRAYSDESIADMSYVELLNLYEGITSKLTEEEIENINSKGIIEEQKENVGLEELLNESVEKREDSLAKKKFIEEKREEEIKEFKEYLKTVLNEDGERKYSDSKLDEMSYVELSLLVEEEKKLQTTKTTTTEELDKEEQKKKFIEEKREEEIKEFKEYLKTVLNEDGERKYSDSKLDEMSYVELSLLVEEEKKLQTTKTTTTEELDKEEQKESDSKESELVQPDIDEINLKNIEKNATTPETDQKIIENYTPTPERAEKLKKGKNTVKSIFLKGMIIVGTMLAFGPVLGPLGIASYNVLAHKIKNGTFNPTGVHGQYLKHNIENIMNIGTKDKGGKVR